MTIKVTKAVTRAQSATIAALLYQMLIRKVSFSMDADHSCVLELDDWNDFLRLMYRAYAAMSRTAAGSYMTEPIRVVLSEYNAYTDVRVSNGAVLYSSLTRIEQ